MPLSDQELRGLLVAAAATDPDEIDCEQFLVAMAEYAETCASGRSVPDALRLVAAHERLCVNCREECAALVELVKPELDRDPTP